MAGEFHILAFVDLDLGEFHPAVEFLDDVLYMGREAMTGSAPVGPEIHQYGYLMGGFDHLGLKIGQAGIELVRGGGMGMEHGEPRLMNVVDQIDPAPLVCCSRYTSSIVRHQRNPR